jgi:transcription elongation factor GreB
VFFGARHALEGDDGQTHRYRIVGPDEFDQPGYISVDSPVAKALLKKARGDHVEVKRPGGVAHYEIMEIHYDESD